MGIITTDDANYTAIANEIRKCAQTSTLYKPSEMAEGVRQACDRGRYEGSEVGYIDGRVDGLAEGVKQGRQEEYDAFWDDYQNSGGEANYYYAFAYGRFTEENYDPKYDIVCTANVTTSSQYIFSNSNGLTDTKVAIYANGRQANGMFNNCTSLRIIRKLVVHEVLAYTGTFNMCSSLEDIIIEGVIGKTLSFAWSPLSIESMKSIIRALKDYSGTSDAFAYTVTFSDDCWNALDADGATSPNGTTWRNYVTEIGWNS